MLTKLKLKNILLLYLSAVRPPSGLLVMSTRGNLTVCWTSPPDDPSDYYITSHPLNNPSASSLWINQSSPGAVWVNESLCVDLGTFTPGQTYDIEVVALRGNDRSQRTSIIHTAGTRNKNRTVNNVLKSKLPNPLDIKFSSIAKLSVFLCLYV